MVQLAGKLRQKYFQTHTQAVMCVTIFSFCKWENAEFLRRQGGAGRKGAGRKGIGSRCVMLPAPYSLFPTLNAI